jgi:hypothetical protein
MGTSVSASSEEDRMRVADATFGTGDPVPEMTLGA